jgi:two-component system OmpR family response regulator
MSPPARRRRQDSDPFDFGELVARLRALARRGPVERDAVWRVGGNHVEIPMSAKEFQLLEVFMRNPDLVLSRYQLRDKLDRPFGTESFETVRGVGYRLRSG